MYTHEYKKMIIKLLFTYACLLQTIYVTALPYENEYGPEYGDEWIMFYDDEGQSHVMNFSTVPNDTRRMILGDAYYHLYTRSNSEPEELHVPSDNQVFTSLYFNASNLIKVATHGWLGSGNAAWLQSLKSEFLKKDSFNVIIIDWHEIAVNPIYPWAALSTRYVGKKTAKLLDAIVAKYQIDGINMHLLGHSLGSQVMAYTALFSNQNIGRITVCDGGCAYCQDEPYTFFLGLDPARPFFELPMMPEDNRLDKSDAEFVDIIHTCGGLYGYAKSHGHADFYPNDGRAQQPGCTGVQNALEACSHGRAYLFFIESINSETLFHAYLCKSWEKFESGECNENFTYMGYHAQIEDSGDYYLHTNSESPFARGETGNTQ